MTGDGGAPSIGIALPIGQGIPVPELVALARQAEACGLDAVNVGEYASTDGMALATAIAAVTERIRIETGIITLAGRSTAQVAMQAATVAGVSGGRFTLGLGAGSPVVAGFHRAPFDHPVSRLAAAVDEVRNLLGGGRLDDGGFALRMPLPWSVPIVLSAISPRMLELAATQADGVLLSLLCAPSMVARLAADARASRPEGRPFEVIALQHAAAGDLAGPARQRVRKELAGYFVVPTYRPAAIDLVGEQGVEDAAAAYQRGGTEALAAWVPDHVVNDLFVAGGEIEMRIKALEAVGATAVRFNPVTPAKGDVTAARHFLDELAEVRR